jgi:hypothetical protein
VFEVLDLFERELAERGLLAVPPLPQQARR